jgi:hypothetical protein
MARYTSSLRLATANVNSGVAIKNTSFTAFYVVQDAQGGIAIP